MKKLDRLIVEAFESRRFKEGEVKFKQSALHDPHIKKALDLIAQTDGVNIDDLLGEIYAKLAEFKEQFEKAPILYHTIVQNFLEEQVFSKFEASSVKVEGSPKFNATWFNLLIERIKGENGEFNPMRGFMDGKRLRELEFILIPRDLNRYPEFKNINTAAATPKGQFIFNTDFLQKLMDWAHLEELKPNGKKYKCNGGEFPDEYAYVEFVILHEFMHYTNDDFHYQKVIKKANPTIINWVGDFRSNYLLVKSGYAQLPLGLYNDKINFDRQKSYIEMYKLVEEEFKKLKKDDQDKIKKVLDSMSDDHGPGQQQGSDMEEGADGEFDENDIDEKAKKQNENFKNAKDKSKAEAEKDAKDKKESDKSLKKEADSGGSGAKGQDGDPSQIDYSNVKPKNWTALIKQFIDTQSTQFEENWVRPKWNHTLGTGGSAPSSGKPTERPTDLKKVKLAFCVDSSGSMSGVVAKVYANIIQILKTRPQLAGLVFTLVRFSSDCHIYKGIFKTDKAAELKDVNDTYSAMPLSLDKVFHEHYGSVTNFYGTTAEQIEKLLADKYNVIIFTDSDVLSGENLESLKKILKIKTGKVFLIFDTRRNYIEFRKITGMATDYHSYVEDEK
jgi:hypothetical protein